MVGMMFDRHISAIAGAAGVLWLAGLGMMVAGEFDLRFMGWGIWLTAVAAVLTVSRMLCSHEGLLRDAFEMGREVERDRDGSVQSLR